MKKHYFYLYMENYQQPGLIINLVNNEKNSDGLYVTYDSENTFDKIKNYNIEL